MTHKRCCWSIVLFSFVVVGHLGCNKRTITKTTRATTADVDTHDSAVAGPALPNVHSQKSRSLDGASLVAAGNRRHALLVGCSDYEHLDEWVQLRGPANDVELLRQLLIDRFEFDPAKDDIVTLAAAEDVDHKPTRANIEREFFRLGENVQPSEPVVILMGGHGSQQPDNDPDNPADSEPDGRDEIFLPADVKKWNGKLGSVENAIVDDEFRVWLRKIVDRGAFVWLIMDACHSGSGVRGSEEEILRQIPPERLVPSEAFEQVQSTSDVDTDSGVESSLFSTDGQGGIVVIYAAQPHETTPERKLPLEADADARKYYGLLTFTICEILTNTSRNLTYNELVQAIQTRYITMGRRAPTPLVEGSHRDNLVLGREAFPDRSRIILEEAGTKGWKINAGALQGITKDSILAVYPPAGSESPTESLAVGHVKVVVAELTSAFVKVCEFADIAASAELPNRGRCEVVYKDFGNQKLRVALDPFDADGEPVSDNVRDKILADLRSESSKMVSIVEETDEADWLARWDSGEVHLVPVSGVSRGDAAGHQQSLAPLRLAPGWSEETIQMLERVARAQNLLRLTSVASGLMQGSDLGFEMTVLDTTEDKAIEWQSDGLTLSDGQRINVQLENHGNQSLDITLLYVDSAYGIACLYPDLGESNRLSSGDQLRIPLKVNADTTGMENLVAIAVRGQHQPVDFSILEQPSITEGRSRGFGDGALNTPLGELCRSAMYGVGGTRGVERSDVQDYGVSVLSWRIKP